MPDGDLPVTISIESGISSIPAAEWDRCAGPDNPFVRHAFLAALEETGCAAPRTGWQPVHMVARDGAGTVVGAVPMYAKSHSYGEYVFDHGWANAYKQAGGQYYPKLQVCVPFSPVPGPRLLISPQAPAGLTAVLARSLRETAAANGVSSIHVTFPNTEDRDALVADGWLERRGVQFHWHNEGYNSFDDFLADLNSRRRKQIKRERRDVAALGVQLHTLTGADITEQHWDAFHSLYLKTADRKWGRGYLNRRFFHRLGETMADAVVLVMAEDSGKWVAGALNLQGSDTLYGRNWGADGSYPFLHFEACYYQALDYAIARGLKRVEAGAQGEHKIQRGYRPTAIFSAHWIADPGFSRAIERFLLQERNIIDMEIADLSQSLPFKNEINDKSETY